MNLVQNAPNLGGVPVEIQISADIKGIPKNKSLLVMINLNQHAPDEPQPEVRCRTIGEAFKFFLPRKDGTTRKEAANFQKVSDFKKYCCSE